MKIEFLNLVKRLVIIALVADGDLMEDLVLKGGNAIDLIYRKYQPGLSRASFDLDFSIEGDFEDEIEEMAKKIEKLLEQAFKEQNLILIDYSFKKKPAILSEMLGSFWGGYRIEFKVIDKELYERVYGNKDRVRRNAISLQPNHSPKFMVEISKHEYVERKIPLDLDGYNIYVYSPEMIVFEKLRALCQQLPQYEKIIPSHSSRARAKDFFDIYLLVDQFKIRPDAPGNQEMIRLIFEAKKVPLSFIRLLRPYKSIHKEDWKNVRDTVSNPGELEDFEYYFDFVLNLFEPLTFL